MKKTYLGAVCEGGGTFGIVFMDFPGCVSAGDTIEKVVSMGREALQGHIELMAEEGEDLPEPSDHQLAEVEAWIGEEGEGERWIGLYPVEVDVPAAPGRHFRKSA